MSFGQLSLVLYVCLIFGTSLVCSLYFNLGETEKKCFIEDVPDDTMIVGNYKVEMFDRLQNKYIPTLAGLGMHVRVHDPDEKVVMSRESISGHYRVLVYDTKLGQFVYTVTGRLGVHVEVHDPENVLIMSRTYAAEGRFTFTSHIAGEHQICLFSNSSAWFGGSQLRVHLDLRVGEGTNDYAEIASKDKLSELQLRVRQLLDQVQQITKEQNYQRTREERFRQTSDSTNQRVLWWAIAQTIILLITGFGQMRHLKSFFEAKKLV